MMSGSGGGKKAVEEIAKKCIGAGCASTRPFMQDKNTDVPVQNNTSTIPSSQPQSVDQTPNNDQSKMKDISTPIESITDKVVMNKPNFNSLIDSLKPAPMQPQKNSNIEHAIKTPLPQISNIKDNSSVTETSYIEKEFSSVNDNAVSSMKEKHKNVVHELTTYGQNDNANIKPSAVKLKTFSNKEFETFLSPDITVNAITDVQLIDDLLKRELVKKHPANTEVKLKLSDDSEYVLGTAKNGIKLSPLGQAYHEIHQLKKNKIEFPIDSAIKKEDIKIMIIVPPQSGEHCFIETGKQKHLIVAFDTKNNNYYGAGYLTSKTSATFLSEKQYKNFEKEQAVDPTRIINANTKEKQQYFVAFDNAICISPENVQHVKYGEEYLNMLPTNSTTYLKTLMKQQLKIQAIEYDIQGLTKDDCLEICKEFDKVAYAKENNPKTKLQHPLSSEQEKTNKKNAEKIINKNIYKSNDNKPNDELLPQNS